MTLVVNLFGGPGTGKSTTCAGTFAELKHRGINAEMVTEYAKDKVWERSLHTLDNQIYIFGKQHHRIFRLLDQVDVIVTDAPLLLSLYYGDQESPTFHRLVLQEHAKMRTYNVFLLREKPFQQAGRLQTEDQAREIDGRLLNILHTYGIDYDRIHANRHAAGIIADSVCSLLKSSKSSFPLVGTDCPVPFCTKKSGHELPHIGADGEL